MTTLISPETALKLCLLERECPHEGQMKPGSTCPLCGKQQDEKGRVPLLDPKLVRESHPECSEGGCYASNPRSSCQGRGWTPSTDPWAYVRAAWWEIDGRSRGDVLYVFKNMLAAGQDPGPACFEVVAGVLLKEAW